MSKILCIDNSIEGLIEKLEGYEEGEALKFVWKFFKQQSESMPELCKDKARLDWLDNQDYAEFGDGLAGDLTLETPDSDHFPVCHGRGTARNCIDAAMEEQNK